MSDLSVLHTKLIPPRLQQRTLVRPRVDELLREALDHRVTIVQASTGYGKSTALACLAKTGIPLFWYTASDGDADPYQFLAHLITAFRRELTREFEVPLALLQDGYPGAVRAAADALLNTLNDSITTPTLLVIDDYHLAGKREVSDLAAYSEAGDLAPRNEGAESATADEKSAPTASDVPGLVDRLLSFLPPDLHVIVSTRYPPQWEHLASWRARGEVLEIRREALAFTGDEIEALFREVYGFHLEARDIERLEAKTEGWPIALQLVWQEARTRPAADLDLLLGPDLESHETLFAFLAQNVLVQQPPPVQEFLLASSVLNEISPAACAAVMPEIDSSTLLSEVRARDLFLIGLGDEHCRYQHLFRNFLRAQASRRDPQGVRERHRHAAEFYRTDNPDEAIYHWLQAGDLNEAAGLIEEIGETVLRAGRQETLARWVDAIPPEIVAARPLLMSYLGELARLRSRFEEALAWYAQAERVWRSAGDIAGISRALRGEALVYLDTVRPARAKDLLQEALRLNDGLDDRVARVRLLELLAENKLNMGKADEAEALRIQAQTLREEGPSEDVLGVRVRLRTGRLDDARTILEEWAAAERGQVHAPRAHRETLLVLALIHAMQGQADAALAVAREGTTLGAALGSPFVSAVGQMRLGHAYQLCGDLRAAINCYEEAMALGDQLAVRRTRAEARWGMTRAHGFGGDLDAARRDAAEGIEVGQSAGDAWIVALNQLALGASAVHASEDREAVNVLADALAAFRACGDTFGRAASRLWLALAHWHLGQTERALAHFEEALGLAETHGYDYLLTRRTLLGWQEARVVVPLLLEAKRRRSHVTRSSAARHASYAAHLLVSMGLENVTAHPGYQLRVQTLGPFQVWRGEQEVTAREWHRRKARELFQLLITNRDKRLEREEILELLWTNEAPDAAARDFKVALNALNRALEPSRASGRRRGEGADTPAFVVREETAYGLRPGADLVIDADEFTELVGRAEKASGGDALDLYRRALALYHDGYLTADARYADWATAARERLLALYLRAADRLATELLTRGQMDECIAWCEQLLLRDRCWEHAYRLMMRAYAARGDGAQVRQVLERCTAALRNDLDVEPSPATVELYAQLSSQGAEREPR